MKCMLPCHTGFLMAFFACLFPLCTHGAAQPAGDTLMPSPQALWERLQKSLPPFSYTIEKDEIISSDTVPGKKLRRIAVRFYSQTVDGKDWGHPSVIFLPADPRIYRSPARRGKVVVVGQRSIDGLATGPWSGSYLGNYGEPIASRTDYPTMIVPVPGEYDGTGGKEIPFSRMVVPGSQDLIDHCFLRLAVPYLRALDVLADILKEKDIRAIIGGHSKRATSAFTAAAADPKRVAGVVYMGNESTFAGMENNFEKPLSPFYTSKYLGGPVLYIGGTNEDGYEMFNINRIEARLERPWTVAMVPNYPHSAQSEKHFMNWQMWVSHVFDGRPITKIEKLSYEETKEGTTFRVHVDSPNKIIQVAVWYVYCDDEPYWRDLMWYSEFMYDRGAGSYEGYVKGKLPDAWLVEVKDIANGFAGYVTSLPTDITHKATKTRVSQGSRSRNWQPKAAKPGR